MKSAASCQAPKRIQKQSIHYNRIKIVSIGIFKETPRRGQAKAAFHQIKVNIIYIMRLK